MITLRHRALAVLAVVALALPIVAPARADSTVAVPVLAEALGLGEVIDAEDVVWVELPFGKVPRNAILDASGLIGMTPKRLIRPGQPVRDGDVVPPVIVKRNGVVVMVFERAGLLLTAKGKALENGAAGEVIRVENLWSGIVVQALVLPDGVVEVGLGVPVALN
ncbi:MAG: flagellar basal body P-ring formation chaperone FlgA [Alphaproteobacteria bacterium]